MEHLQAQHDSTGNLPINELPVMGFLYLRKDFWDRHGAKIATCWKNLAKGCFDVQKNDFGEKLSPSLHLDTTKD